MLKKITLAAVVLLGSTVLSLAAEPTGHYKMEGKSPDGSSDYTGTVDVTKTDETARSLAPKSGLRNKLRILTRAVDTTSAEAEHPQAQSKLGSAAEENDALFTLPCRDPDRLTHALPC